jgi:hypothetical protein
LVSRDTAYAWREAIRGIDEDDQPLDGDVWKDVDADEA